ncbi:MAG: RNA helicase [Saprospirales bacterium]|nr:RNA helicase [Saprospirales bacterium]
MTNIPSFSDLGVAPDILAALEVKGFTQPTPIQAGTIPLLLNGEKDIVAQAQTGTGKTAAFGIPVLQRITPGLGKVQAIVLAPTRELANQVCEEMSSLTAVRDIKILPIYGGQDMGAQLRALRKGVDVVVGTPGRVIDHLNRKSLRLDDVQYVILDEADEMLNMGFLEPIETILGFVPQQRRMLLFSATMPAPILKLARQFMGEYDVVKMASNQDSSANVEQVFYEIKERDKLRALKRLIDSESEFYSLVFCRTRAGSDRLAAKLSQMGYNVEALHGDVSQSQRERILEKFKNGHSSMLVATDVAARGIDVNNLSHVINFDLPDNPEVYVHRIGRTGRAGSTGKAISFVSQGEFGKIRHIMKATRTEIAKKSLPAGQEVVEAKCDAIKQKVFDAAEGDIPQAYHNLAKEMLASGKPATLLAALLKEHYGTKLDAGAYPEITEPERNRYHSRHQEFSHKQRGKSNSYYGKRKSSSFKRKRHY